MPVTKEKDSRVIGGTINKSGSFVMRADKIGRDTLLSRIVQMVASAQRSRAPIQRLADQVSAWFVPTVIAIALIAFMLVPNGMDGVGGLTQPHIKPGQTFVYEFAIRKSGTFMAIGVQDPDADARRCDICLVERRAQRRGRQSARPIRPPPSDRDA